MPSTDVPPTESRQRTIGQSESALRLAISEWRREVSAVVVDSPAELHRYRRCTTGVARQISAAIRATSVDDIVRIVQIANRHRVPLYPISTGNNWGYGSANPVCDGCVILDLSAMNRICEFDADLGLVTVEPGVTPQQLHDYLVAQGLPYFVPVHGGGPDCSLMGNALERGYGLTPYADHFAAITSLEAVLADGRVYRSALSELACSALDRAFKWGIGPYLDGLFAQGSFGIVTKTTIALARIPSVTEAFIFSIPDDRLLEPTVAAVQRILRTLGSTCSSINLMNARRVLSMIAPYPRSEVPAGAAIPDEVVSRLSRQHGVSPWNGAGALYGDRAMVKAARKCIRRELNGISSKFVSFDAGKLSRWRAWLGMTPSQFLPQYRKLFGTAEQFLQIVSGVPQRTALRLAYWKSRRLPDDANQLHPARDRCGLIWYSPLVRMKPAEVRQYVGMVERVCPLHGHDPLITLTSLNDRLFDSTVPVLFEQQPDEAERAEACYRALLEAGLEGGFSPYRVGVQHMGQVVRPNTTFWELVSELKAQLDPHDLISPGRYAPTSRWHAE